ncbi:MAG TPA: acyl carrier protein [Bryobacteraceae bacterium]|nr:acyl carrier protein [Bryobacteraceae bacterium]
MNEAYEQLLRCFSTVFPSLSRQEILNANSESVPGWDSLAMVTLLAVIEEEFAIQFPPSEIESLTSFDAFWNCLQGRIISRGTSDAAQCSAAKV